MALRLRFAPSPTGDLHIGSARTALYNYLLARANDGVFVLRIEDTDHSRSTEEAIGGIIEDMLWLGLQWDEGPDVGGSYGPYRQTERSESYEAAARKLLREGAAYSCYCEPGKMEEAGQPKGKGRLVRDDCTCRQLTRAELEKRESEGQPYAVRFRAPEGSTEVRDLIRGSVVFDNASVEDFVLLRRGGNATYNLAVVVDDIEMKITHVIRGEDHLSNTPKQILVYQALGEEPPAFAHMPLTVGADGKPLSKRHGDVAVARYREQGFLPEAMINYLALLGWSLDDSTTLIDKDTLTASFSLERVSSNPGTWDMQKLLWMNGQYIMGLEEGDLADRLEPFLTAAGLFETGDKKARAVLERIVPLIRERLKILSDAPALTAFFFHEVTLETPSLELMRGEKAMLMLADARRRLAATDPFSAPHVEEALREAASTLELKPREAFQPIRLAITSSKVSPPLFESMEILGRERCLLRLDRTMELVGKLAP